MLLRPFRVRAKLSPQNPMPSLTTMLLGGPLHSTLSLLQVPFLPPQLPNQRTSLLVSPHDATSRLFKTSWQSMETNSHHLCTQEKPCKLWPYQALPSSAFERMSSMPLQAAAQVKSLLSTQLATWQPLFKNSWPVPLNASMLLKQTSSFLVAVEWAPRTISSTWKLLRTPLAPQSAHLVLLLTHGKQSLTPCRSGRLERQ